MTIFENVWLYDVFGEIEIKHSPKKGRQKSRQVKSTFVAQIFCPYGWNILKQKPSFEDGLSIISKLLINTVPTQWWCYKKQESVYTIYSKERSTRVFYVKTTRFLISMGMLHSKKFSSFIKVWTSHISAQCCTSYRNLPFDL